MFGFKANADERLRKSLNNEGRILDSNGLDFYYVSSSYFFENESLFNYINEKNLSIDEWIDFYNGFVYSMSDIIKVLEEVDSDELKLNYSDTVDGSGERELKEEDMNDNDYTKEVQKVEELLNKKYPNNNLKIEYVNEEMGEVKFEEFDKPVVYAIRNGSIFFENEYELFIKKDESLK
jgi:hypothetical protein